MTKTIFKLFYTNTALNVDECKLAEDLCRLRIFELEKYQ